MIFKQVAREIQQEVIKWRGRALGTDPVARKNAGKVIIQDLSFRALIVE